MCITEEIDENLCDECYECYWYWENNDTGEECQGQKNPCHEFIKKKS